MRPLELIVDSSYIEMPLKLRGDGAARLMAISFRKILKNGYAATFPDVVIAYLGSEWQAGWVTFRI